MLCAIFAKGLNYMLNGLKVSCLLIFNTILFVNISTFLGEILYTY